MRETTKGSLKGQLILLVTAILWGSCFVFQKRGMEYVGPFTLGVFRFILGGLALIPVICFASAAKKRNSGSEQGKPDRSVLLKGGFICGVVLFLAASLQQIGLVNTTAGKAAFLTSMQIVAVEIVGTIFARRLHLNTAAGTVLAVLGMYFLCITRGLSMQTGDILELVGSLFWGAQIIAVGRYAKLTDGIKLSFIQFIVAGGLSAIAMLIAEKPNAAAIVQCTVPILYTAVIEVALCFTLQIIGQKYVAPVLASVLLSLESVFAVLFGAAFLSEALTAREIAGMAMMLASVVVIQIPVAKYKEWAGKKS